MSLLVEPETTREDIVLALANVNALAKRCPSHFVAEHAKWHAEIDNLLTELQSRPA